MTPTRFLIGQFLMVLGLIVVGFSVGTQWAAHRLGYQPRLGAPWFVVLDIPVYHPWRLFEWWYAYEAYAPHVFRRAGLIASSGGVLGVVFAVSASLWRARQGRVATTYGSARWARLREIREADLFNPAGVFLGRYGSHYLRHAGPEHVMAFAPTRSGKGVGLVVPTLLTWHGSVVVHDLKGENWTLTAGWRGGFSRVLRFDPTDLKSIRYNPLLEVRCGPFEVRDVQNIADILVDPEGTLDRRSHWDKTAHALLTGVILHVLYAEGEKTLAQVASFLADPSRSIARALEMMLTTAHVDGYPHPVVAEAARELLNKSENERSGVVSTALSFLSLYRDPVVKAVTGASDFRIRDLLDAGKPLSLYLVVPPSDLSRTKPLMRLILNQVGRRLTEDWRASRRHDLLLMLDEFPALGRLDFFESALAYLAGYGIRAYLIAQSLNQIEKAYGPNNAILDNCHVRIAFATNDERTAKRISDALGTATENRFQKNYAGHRLAPWLAHVMVARQETARPLLTPGEVMQLPADEALVMIAGLSPIRARKLRYYQDRNFLERLKPAPVSEQSSDPVTHNWQDMSARQSANSDAIPDAGGTVQARDHELAALDPDPALFDDLVPDVDVEPADLPDDIPPLRRAHEFNRREADRGDDDLLPNF